MKRIIQREGCRYVRRNAFSTATFLFMAVAIVVLGMLWLSLQIQAVSASEVALILDPYASIDWEHLTQYKLNLHTHTTESDGQMPPAQVIDEYYERGYDGLAITDHNLSTWPWSDFGRDPEALGMVAIPGNELSRHHHTLSLFTAYETDATDIDMALRGVAEAGGLAVLCHPAMHWLREYDTPGLQVSLTSPLRDITRDDFTIETWFRTTNTERNILMGNYSSAYKGALNLELHTDNRVRIYLEPHGDGNTVNINVSADGLNIDTRDGQWHHLAGIRRSATVFLYLDGQLVGSAVDRAGAFSLRGDTFFLGRDTRAGSTPLTGDLFQARLWRRALDGSEVAALAAGADVPTDGLLAQYAVCDVPGADTAGHPAGPFKATIAGTAPRVINEAPSFSGNDSKKSLALRFGGNGFPEFVPDATVAHFVALFQRHRHLTAIEVLNRTRPEREYPLDRELWDRLLSVLMPERPVWGAAVDDMHRIQHLGGDWIVIPASHLDEATARTALEAGNYYFASTRLHEPGAADVAGTPRIERIDHDAAMGRIDVAATVAGKPVDDSAYAWIAGGRTVQTGPTLFYRDIAGLGVYARVEITGPGGTTYTNPFGFTAMLTSE